MSKVGQWINSYSKGIFRIEKILDRYYDDFDEIDEPKKKIGDKYADRIVISKRLLNSKFKKSINYDSCSEYFISPIDKEQERQLRKLIKDNPDWLVDLDNYIIPELKEIYNWPVQLNGTEKNKAKEIMTLIETGLTLKQIHTEIKKRGLKENFDRPFGNYVLQMINLDYETLNKKRIWRKPQLLKM